MSRGSRNRLSLAALAAALMIASLPAKAQTMTRHATGEFDVKIVPVTDEKGEGASLGRLSLEKQFRGALCGFSKGEMLTAVTSTKGSAGYVAIERFVGTLDGMSGTFVLQHTGTMARGGQQLSIAVVPDSGAGQLTGVSGRMAIRITEGKHFYEFDYELK